MGELGGMLRQMGYESTVWVLRIAADIICLLVLKACAICGDVSFLEYLLHWKC